MSRHDHLNHVLDSKLVAILRTDSSEQLVHIAEALCEGGIDIIEVTLTVPDALSIIDQVRKRLGDRILLGAGTVLDAQTARAAMLAGAEFIVSPVTDVDLITTCHRYDKLIMPGAYTPTEVLTAWQAGADVVKIFPATSGGAGHLKALKGPLPQVRMMPTGGVNLNTIDAFFDAGACAVGLGGALLDKQAIAEANYAVLTETASQYVDAIHTRFTR